MTVRHESAEPCDVDPVELGESCRWDAIRRELLWVDVLRGDLFRATAAGTHLEVLERVHVDGHLTSVSPVEPPADGWVVTVTRSVVHLGVDGTCRELAAPEHHNAPRVRLNDGCCDRAGRLWVGSMAYDNTPGAGSLYRFSSREGLERVREGVTISNGIGWSPDGTEMYYVDSGAATLEALDFDEATGRIGDPRLVAALDGAEEGVPDGLCVDAEGAIWVAVWGGGEVRRYSPAGELIAVVGVAASQPSSCAIGGASGTTLYVTSAREGMSASQLAGEPLAGAVFACPVDVPGLPVGRFRLA
ncbi:MAG: SMP-30/gluconolactonase/LRE family protein [Actinomycetota bacterium]|nr:SMP-30/gluconolactonase/LRE family protein [Actinomycetota bacterium]